MKINLDLKKQKNNLIYIFFSITLFAYIFCSVADVSTFPQIINLPDNKYYLFILFFISIIGLLTLNDIHSFDIIFYIFGYTVSIVSYVDSRTLIGLSCMSIILFSKNKNFYRIMRIYFWALLISIVFIVTSNLIGIIPSEYFVRSNGAVRNAFGFTHPNVFGGYILALNCSYYLWKSQYRIKIKNIWLAVVSILVLHFFVDANTCTAILIGIFLYILYDNLPHEHRSGKAIKYIMICLFVFFIIDLLIFIRDNGTSAIIAKLFGETVEGRLSLAHLGLERYGVSLFGKRIYFIGTDFFNTHTYSGYSYFIVDNLYVHILINSGLFVFIIFFGSLIAILIKSIMKQKNYIFVISFLLLIYSIFESGLAYFGMSFIFAALSANIVTDDEFNPKVSGHYQIA